MAERIQYVMLHFERGVTPPTVVKGNDKSVLLDAFKTNGREDGTRNIRAMKLERDGDCIIATDVHTGFVREYPWSSVRQSLREDERHENNDPRQPRRKVAEAKGKAP